MNEKLAHIKKTIYFCLIKNQKKNMTRIEETQLSIWKNKITGMLMGRYSTPTGIEYIAEICPADNYPFEQYTKMIQGSQRERWRLAKMIKFRDIS